MQSLVELLLAGLFIRQIDFVQCTMENSNFEQYVQFVFYRIVAIVIEFTEKLIRSV